MSKISTFDIKNFTFDVKSKIFDVKNGIFRHGEMQLLGPVSKKIFGALSFWAKHCLSFYCLEFSGYREKKSLCQGLTYP